MKIILFFLLLSLSKKEQSNRYILISKPDPVIRCGGLLLTGEFYFINSEDSTAKIGIIICPDGYGDDFFKKEKKYAIKFSRDSTIPEGYSSMNTFYTDSVYVPKRIVTEIKKVD